MNTVSCNTVWSRAACDFMNILLFTLYITSNYVNLNRIFYFANAVIYFTVAKSECKILGIVYFREVIVFNKLYEVQAILFIDLIWMQCWRSYRLILSQYFTSSLYNNSPVFVFAQLPYSQLAFNSILPALNVSVSHSPCNNIARSLTMLSLMRQWTRSLSYLLADDATSSTELHCSAWTSLLAC